jgi:DNA-binding MarR family transcriptional regulator
MRMTMIARVFRTRFDRRAREIGLTRAQWSTIACIRDQPGATQHMIATALEVGDVTAGRCIDRLEEAGWVERRPDPEDRRVYRIYATDVATPVLARLGALGQDEENIAFAGFTDTELQQLKAMLNRIMGNLSDTDCAAA